MNRLFIILLIGLLFWFNTNGHAQDISVEFILDNDAQNNSDTLSPYLIIRYSNHSANDYYFPALAYTDRIEPIFKFPMWRKELPTWSKHELTEILRSCNGEKMCLPLRFIEAKHGASWLIVPDDQEDEHEVDLMNLFLQLYHNDSEEIEWFHPDEISRPCLIKNSDAFIFLKAGKVKEQKISLSGLKLAGIILRIYLSDTTSRIKVHSNNPNIEYDLPLTICHYSLYTGTFFSNELIIDFSGNTDCAI